MKKIDFTTIPTTEKIPTIEKTPKYNSELSNHSEMTRRDFLKIIPIMASATYLGNPEKLEAIIPIAIPASALLESGLYALLGYLGYKTIDNSVRNANIYIYPKGNGYVVSSNNNKSAFISPSHNEYSIISSIVNKKINQTENIPKIHSINPAETGLPVDENGKVIVETQTDTMIGTECDVQRGSEMIVKKTLKEDITPLLLQSLENLHFPEKYRKDLTIEFNNTNNRMSTICKNSEHFIENAIERGNTFILENSIILKVPDYDLHIIKQGTGIKNVAFVISPITIITKNGKRTFIPGEFFEYEKYNGKKLVFRFDKLDNNFIDITTTLLKKSPRQLTEEEFWKGVTKGKNKKTLSKRERNMLKSQKEIDEEAGWITNR